MQRRGECKDEYFSPNGVYYWREGNCVYRCRYAQVGRKSLKVPCSEGLYRIFETDEEAAECISKLKKGE